MHPDFDWPSVFRFRWLLGPRYDIKEARIVATSGDAPEWYVPDSDAPDAHREFVALPRHDHEAMLAFVRKYGFLGIETEGARASTHFGPEFLNVAERLDRLWLEQQRLATFAQYSKDDPDKDTRNQIFNRLSPAHMSVQLEEEHGRTVLRVVPNSLISWMWLRFAQEKAKGYEVRTCALPGCNVTREIGHDATKRWKYCCPEHRALHNYRTKAVKRAEEEQGGEK
ncbi:hypothetical protein BL241_11580 [Ralstonia solanacearum]|nr:hypothetical protein BL241_11580 [Ralstonia solanacearum]